MEEKENKQKEKLSYEQLEAAAGQLVETNNKMREYIAKQDYANFHQRVSYLFKVIELSEKFDLYFVTKCKCELEDILFSVEEDTNKKEE